MCMGMAACSNNTSSSTTGTSASTKAELTESDIKNLVPSALLKKLKDSYIPNNVDVMATTYETSTVEWDSKDKAWVAYGRCWLYEKTGSLYEMREYELHFRKDGTFISTDSSVSKAY